MNFGEMNISKTKIILGVLFILILLGATAGALYIFQTKQFIFKSRASTNFINAFTITDNKGKTINCDSSTNPPTCTTDSLDINIKVNPDNLDALK